MKRRRLFCITMFLFIVFIFTAVPNRSSQVRVIRRGRGDRPSVSFSKEKVTKDCAALLSFPRQGRARLMTIEGVIVEIFNHWCHEPWAKYGGMPHQDG